jgi:hypothetical protein
MLVILATWEAEIWSITVLGQPGQTVHKIPFQPIAGYSDMQLSYKPMCEAEMGRTVGASLAKKTFETPSQKAGCGGMCLSSQLPGEA